MGLPLGLEDLTEGGVDSGAIQVRNRFTPFRANPFVGGGFVEGSPVEAGGVLGAGVEEGFDSVGVGLGDFPGQVPFLRVHVRRDAVHQALLVAVAKLHRADLGAAGLLSAVGRSDRREGSH